MTDYAGNEGELVVNSFCGYLCRAIPHYSIGRPTAGEWHTFRISLRELGEKGLRVERISNPLFISFDGATRAGVNIQLNNVGVSRRAVKSVMPVPADPPGTGISSG